MKKKRLVTMIILGGLLLVLASLQPSIAAERTVRLTVPDCG